MSLKVILYANTLAYPHTGGNLWVFLNWALGLRACGCSVTWLEGADPRAPVHETMARLALLRERLEPFGFAGAVALCSKTSDSLGSEFVADEIDGATIDSADLLLNLGYCQVASLIKRFRRSAFVDIDPGLTQFWISGGFLKIPPHDVYFSIGETVGTSRARFPDAGLSWLYTPPCVSLGAWQSTTPSEGAPFTTVTHWTTDSWVTDGDETYSNSKRSGFLPFIELPLRTPHALELALTIDGEDEEREMLLRNGWGVRDSVTVSSTPWDYHAYLQGSTGEFSCAKPSCVRFQNAWVSDRTLCYLASGRPAVVQHSGPSEFLPDAEGLFRFRTPDDAVRQLDIVMADYAHQCTLARALAEEYFDADKVVARLLERVT